jgi:hypothetical protein
MVRETRTDGRGEFTLPLLPAGSYEVSVTSPGFRVVIRPSVRVDIDSITRIDFVLPLGIVEQRIEVRGAPPLINAQNGTVGEVMDGARISALPLNERNFLVLGLLTAGAEPGTDGSQNTILGSALSIDGVREQSNYFLLDGVDNNDPFLNQFSVLPSVEAIDEFKVQSSNSSAQFGRSAGGQINVALKSGSNSSMAACLNSCATGALTPRTTSICHPARPHPPPAPAGRFPASTALNLAVRSAAPCARTRHSSSSQMRAWCYRRQLRGKLPCLLRSFAQGCLPGFLRH